MFAPNEVPWIEAGYEAFGLHGPETLKVEQLSRTVGISKSSFYHHFADIPVFIERLLHYHYRRGEALAAATRACRAVDPDFLRVLEAGAPDLRFQRQLRIRRDNLAYQLSFQRTHRMVEDEVIGIWAEAMGIPGQERLARSIFSVTTDLFYQRATNDSFTYEWMVKFLHDVKGFMQDLVHNSEVR